MKKIPNHKIEFSAQESEQSNCTISITLPQGWKFQEKTKKSGTEREPLMLAGLNLLYTMYDIYDSNQTLVGTIGYSDYEPYEGDKDSVQIVYSTLRLGSVYRFDTDSRYEVFHTQIGVGNRLDGGRRRVKKYLWSFFRTAPAGQVRL